MITPQVGDAVRYTGGGTLKLIPWSAPLEMERGLIEPGTVGVISHIDGDNGNRVISFGYKGSLPYRGTGRFKGHGIGFSSPGLSVTHRVMLSAFLHSGTAIQKCWEWNNEPSGREGLTERNRDYFDFEVPLWEWTGPRPWAHPGIEMPPVDLDAIMTKGWSWFDLRDWLKPYGFVYDDERGSITRPEFSVASAGADIWASRSIDQDTGSRHNVAYHLGYGQGLQDALNRFRTLTWVG